MTDANLKETGRRLLALQEVDLHRAEIRERADQLPQKRVVAALRAKQAEGDQRLAQIKERLEQSKHQERIRSGELADLEEKINEEQQKIEAATDHRELAALTQDLEGLARRRSALEDESLELLEKQQNLENLRTDITDKIAALKAREESEIADYRCEAAALTDELKEQDARRAQIAETLPAELLARYDRLAEEKDGLAVARYRGGRCLVCSLAPPTAKRALIEASDQIENCPHCHRLLVVEDDDD